MNKNNLHIVVLLLFLNLFTLFKLNSFRGTTERQLRQNTNEINRLQQEIGNIYNNVEETMKKEASIIDNYDITIGEKFNTDDLTVPVSIHVTPKEYSDNMKAVLQVKNKDIPMEKDGISFAANTDVFIFDDFEPKIILERDGVQKIETLEDYYNLKDKYLLNIDGGYSGNSNKDRYKGSVNLLIAGGQNNAAEKLNLVETINGNVTNEIPVNLSEYTRDDSVQNISFDVDEKCDLAVGDKFMLYADIQDVYGINYKYVLLAYDIESNGRPARMRPEWTAGSIIEISDKNGNILYSPEYLTN